jgi:protein-tyrosine phosphatase
VDWDSPPIYDIDIKDEDLVGDSLSFDQEKKSVVDLDWVSPTIYDDIYPDEEDLLNEVSFLVDAIKFIEENNDYHVLDESPHNKGF